MYHENYQDCKAIVVSLTHSKNITDAGVLACQSLANATFRGDLPEQTTFLRHSWMVTTARSGLSSLVTHRTQGDYGG